MSAAAARRLTTIATHITRPSLQGQLSRPSSIYTSKNFNLGSSISSTSAMVGSAKQYVDPKIAENNVVIFGKSWCPYCRKAKTTMSATNEEFLYVDIDNESSEAEIQGYLQSISGQRTVPQIWIGQKFIGGSDDLSRIPKPDLLKRIAAGKK